LREQKIYIISLLEFLLSKIKFYFFSVNLRENYKDYLVFIISDTEQNGSSYEILVETATNSKMIEFSQLDNNLLNYLFSF
jgi:hypothetical protein